MRDTEGTVLEITCPDCASEYELAYDEDETEEPVYCPFCGTDCQIPWWKKEPQKTRTTLATI